MTVKNPLLSVSVRLKQAFNRLPSLSDYFPEGTQFYYGYPSGEDSGFLNKVTPAVEELVAARVTSCAGSKVAPVVFAATTTKVIEESIFNDFGIPKQPERAVILSADIGVDLVGRPRNEAIRAELGKQLKDNKFVMAQPYTDRELTSFYQIPPSITAYMNDKYNMVEYIDPKWLPKRLASFESGKVFARKFAQIKPPVVIKASSSSSGDGVHICFTEDGVKIAAEKLKDVSGSIIVEEMVDYVKNYGVHFGIPHDKNKPAELIGVNEQITSQFGEFMGGIIDARKVPEALDGAVDHLINAILPKVRQKGWYGIGGFDILVDKEGNAYFIDCNFRMTGMSAYHFLIDNGKAKRPLLSVSGEFRGTAEQFKEALIKYAGAKSRDKFLTIICLSKHDDLWRFNGALEYEDREQLSQRAKILLEAGIKSAVLEVVG